MEVLKIKEVLKENRPNISSKTIDTYTSILKNIYKKYHQEGDEPNIKWFQDEDKIINYLVDINPSIRKTYLSSLIAINKDSHNAKYKMLMMKDAEQSKLKDLKQEKTEKQEKNWITQEEIKQKFEMMAKQCKTLWNKKDLTKQEYKQCQDLILVALTSGLFIPPRRSLDITELKLKDVDETKDNYIKKSEFHFNVYKGAKVKGEQIIKIPKELVNLLKKFMKLNLNKVYLIEDSQGKKMNSVKLNQHLEKIWGKKISTNIYRHSYLSSKYPANFEEMKKDADQMGTSTNMILQSYVKKD